MSTYLPTAPAHGSSREPAWPGTLRLALILLLALAPTPELRAQTVSAQPAPDPARPVLRAQPLAGTIVIDGRLDEAAWEAAEPSTDFVQRQPVEGAAPTERTEVRILYDAAALYVGARLYDSRPDSIVAQLARRDNVIYSDWFHLGIDSYFDRRTAFVFGVNARGVKHDMMLVDDRRSDTSWDAVWDVATARDSLGWTAEFRIPLSQLRFPARPGEQVWGLQFRRWIARKNEFIFWSPLPRNAHGDVSYYGTLVGLRGLPTPRRLELVPYSVGRVTRAPIQAGNPLNHRQKLYGSAGADLRYGISSNLTLSASLNPDFGQVEADPSEVNLTAFETRFAERRPLFVEGADIFHVGVGADWWGGEQLFYSRRIGRPPQRHVSLAGGYVDAPTATKLLGAAKLSGKTGDGWSIGVLDVVTAREEARTVDSEGGLERAVVEPLTNYGVVRVKRDFRAGRSAVGGIFTSTHRQLSEDADLEFLRSEAYAGGLDARHRFGRGNYELRTSLLGSHIRGSALAIQRAQRSSVRYFQRPDAAHLAYDSTRTSLSGFAAAATVWKLGGGKWRGALDGLVRSPGFEINDLGFQREADRISGNALVIYEDFTVGRILRRRKTEAFTWSQWSFGRERVDSGTGTANEFQLLNYWGGYFGAERLFPALAPEVLRGGPAVRTPGRLVMWSGFFSDSRRKLVARLGATAEVEDESGASRLGVEPTLTYRPSGKVELSLSPAMAWNSAAWQYVAERSVAGEPYYVVAALEQRTASLTARLNYTFAPNLSLQTYAQPFISAGEYSAFQLPHEPRAARRQDRFRRLTEDELSYDADGQRYLIDLDGDGAADFSFPDRDFNFKEVKANTVFRWEYRPGSTLFVVWSHGRSAFDLDGSFRLRRDASQLFRSDDTNVLLVKLTYWMNR